MLLILLVSLLIPMNFNRDGLTDSYTEHLEKGVTLFYSGNWSDAQASFESLISTDESAPEAWFFRSMIPFWKYFFGGETKQDAKEFLSWSEKAIYYADKHLKTNPADTSIVLLLSGLHGYRALVAADQQEYLIAIKSGITGFDFTKQILAMDESKTEAKIGRGIYYYMSGSVPSAFRWMLGFKGDKEMAFSELEVAGKSDSRIQVDANLILTYLYLKENHPYKAFQSSLRLLKSYPDNSIFRYLHAQSLERIGKNQQAVEFYTSIVNGNDTSIQQIVTDSNNRKNHLEAQLNDGNGGN